MVLNYRKVAMYMYIHGMVVRQTSYAYSLLMRANRLEQPLSRDRWLVCLPTMTAFCICTYTCTCTPHVHVP